MSFLNLLKRLKEAAGILELLPKLIGVLSLLAGGTVTIYAYMIEFSLIGMIFLLLGVTAATYAALYWWQKKKQTDPKRHDKSLVRRLSSASSNLSAIWRPLSQFTDIPSFDEALNEFFAAAEPFIFDTELGPKIVRARKAVLGRKAHEGQLRRTQAEDPGAKTTIAATEEFLAAIDDLLKDLSWAADA